MHDALVYPEYIDSKFLYTSSEGHKKTSDNDVNCAGILKKLENWQKMLVTNIALPKVRLYDFSQKALRPKYAELLESLFREQ